MMMAVMTAITLWCHQTWLENPRTEWRFLARKTPDFSGLFSPASSEEVSWRSMEIMGRRIRSSGQDNGRTMLDCLTAWSPKSWGYSRETESNPNCMKCFSHLKLPVDPPQAGWLVGPKTQWISVYPISRQTVLTSSGHQQDAGELGHDPNKVSGWYRCLLRTRLVRF